MKLNYIPFCVFFLMFFSPIMSQGQEVSEARTIQYTFSLNTIKHQAQVDGVVAQTKAIKDIISCELDWLNYKMIVIAKEGEDRPTLSIEKIKAILIENNVALVNFTKEEMK